jgi:hypothetical protein
MKNLSKLTLAGLIITITQIPEKSLAVELVNPLTNTNQGLNPTDLYGRIVAGFLGVIGAVALTYFIWGGFLWLTSAGSPEKIKKGKDTIVWAIIGLILVFSSYIILKFVLSTITTATGTTP